MKSQIFCAEKMYSKFEVKLIKITMVLCGYIEMEYWLNIK